MSLGGISAVLLAGGAERMQPSGQHNMAGPVSTAAPACCRGRALDALARATHVLSTVPPSEEEAVEDPVRPQNALDFSVAGTPALCSHLKPRWAGLLHHGAPQGHE